MVIWYNFAWRYYNHVATPIYLTTPPAVITVSTCIPTRTVVVGIGLSSGLWTSLPLNEHGLRSYRCGRLFLVKAYSNMVRKSLSLSLLLIFCPPKLYFFFFCPTSYQFSSFSWWWTAPLSVCESSPRHCLLLPPCPSLVLSHGGRGHGRQTAQWEASIVVFCGV